MASAASALAALKPAASALAAESRVSCGGPSYSTGAELLLLLLLVLLLLLLLLLKSVEKSYELDELGVGFGIALGTTGAAGISTLGIAGIAGIENLGMSTLGMSTLGMSGALKLDDDAEGADSTFAGKFILGIAGIANLGMSGTLKLLPLEADDDDDVEAGLGLGRSGIEKSKDGALITGITGISGILKSAVELGAELEPEFELELEPELAGISGILKSKEGIFISGIFTLGIITSGVLAGAGAGAEAGADLGAGDQGFADPGSLADCFV